MLGQQFYHETIRKVVISFGTMFNSINLVRKDNSGAITQTMKVPLAYGPREKFLVRLRDDADLSKQVAITLPRIGFEIKNLSYDPARKLNRVQKFRKVKGSNTKQLDTLSTCEYISSLVMNMKWHYEKEESNKIILIPLYTKTSDVEKK